MDQEFIDRQQSMQLTKEEGEVVHIRSTNKEKTIEDCSLTLLGRFLTARPYNQRAAKALLMTVWKLGNDLRIVDVGKWLFQFRFKLKSQLTWVLNNGPWSFNNILLVLRRWERGMTANSMIFSVLPIWVQVWGLSFDLMNEETGWEISKGLGHVVDVDKKTFLSDQVRFIRIRIELPLKKLIRRGGWVANVEGDQVCVGFKYVRLVGLCYQCGRFGHEMKDCPSPGTTQQTARPYGEWLKAGLQRKESASDRSTSSPPMQQTVPERDEQTRSQTIPHVETADVIGIKSIYDSHRLVTQTTKKSMIATVTSKHLLGAQSQETNHINADDYGRTKIIGMEINGFEIMATDSLDPSLINVPIKYDEEQARDTLSPHLNQPRDALPSHSNWQPCDPLPTHSNQPHDPLQTYINQPFPTHLNQPYDPLPTHPTQPRDPLQTQTKKPCASPPFMGKKIKPRNPGNKTSGNKISRHKITQTHTDPKETISRKLKRDKPEENLPLEEELKQNEKRSKAMEYNPKNIIIKTVEAAGQPRREQ